MGGGKRMLVRGEGPWRKKKEEKWEEIQNKSRRMYNEKECRGAEVGGGEEKETEERVRGRVN